MTFSMQFENNQVNIWSKHKAYWLANVWFSYSRMLFLWWHTEKTFGFWVCCPRTPTRGFAPEPHWGPTATPRPPHHFLPFSLFPSPMSASSSSSSSLCSQLYLWGSPFWVRFLHIEGSGPEWYISSMRYSQDIPSWSGTLDVWPLFNPAIEVVTFRPMMMPAGVFLLPAFTRLGHACQDLLSPWDGMYNNNNNRIQRRNSRFFTISSQRRELSQMYVQVARAQPCANHVQHIERLSRASVMFRATWYKGTAQLLSLTELKSHLFELYFIGWTIIPMKEGRKPEYPEKTPGDELQSVCVHGLDLGLYSHPKEF